jgi:hypothetical protein
MLNKLTTAKPIMWRGADVNIELGLFIGSAMIDVVAPLSMLYLDILATRSGAPILQKSVAAAGIVATPTVETWNAGSAQNLTIPLTAAETQFDLSGVAAVENTRDFWLVVHALTTGGKKITWGVANITVEEDGAQNDLAVVPMSNPNFRIKNGELQLWNPTQSKWHTFYPTGAAGQETTAWGAGED